MFYLQKAFLNIKRNRLKSLLVVLVCSLIVLFLFLYIGGMQANRQQLASLPQAMPVYARVSNLNGSLNTGILIQERIIKGLEDSRYVTEYSYAVRPAAALGRISKEEVPYMEKGSLTFPLALGVNGLAAYPSMSAENITFMEGTDSKFLEGEEALCIVRDRELEREGLRVGDSVWMTLFYPTYPGDNFVLDYKWVGAFQVKIVGSYGDVWDTESEFPSIQIIFPAKWIQKTYEQAEVMFFADSARFQVADPLELNAFKAEMKKLNLMSVISQSMHSHQGNALKVNDETFVRAASRLMENIILMQVFTPFVCVIVGLVGFVVSYLLMRSRKPEIAVMRSIGMSRRNCFTLLFLENAVLDLTGSALGILCAALFTKMGVFLVGTVVALFFVCYMAGTMVALLLLGRFSVMAVLTALE